MTGRERITRAIAFERPDRVPINYAITAIARQRHGAAVAELERRFPSDFGGGGARSLDINRARPGTQTDLWGCVWRNETPGLVGMAVQHPLAEWDARRTYRFPKPEELLDLSGLKEGLARNAGEKFVVGTGQWLWQRMFWLRGFESLLMDIAEGREEVAWLRDEVLRVQTGVVAMWLDYDIDAIWFWDDWGTQQSLMVQPETWRRLFKSAYKELFALVHEGGKKVIFHTDGNVGEIVGDLVEIGADVLNLQVPVIPKERLDRHVSGKVCLLGGMDLQGVLASGDSRATEEHIRDLLTRFATPRGGYIGQVIMDDTTRMENARVVAERIATYRP